MKRGGKFFVLVALIAAGAYAGYHFFLKPAEAKYIYRTQAVTRGSITSTISATGKVNAVEMVDVGTQVSGTIKEIYVDYNSPVKKGQLIAILDPDVLLSKVAEARASLSVAQAGVAKANADLTDAKRNDARNKELWNRKLIARSEMESTETSLAVSRAALVEANARVAQANETLKQAQTNLGYATIHSPIDGVVVDKAVEAGQTVAASMQTPTLFSIARDLTQMQIEANIDEADIGRIQEGQRAICKFDSWADESFDAVVTQKRLNPETVSNVVTYVVILKIDNAEKKLMPGMTANLSIITEQRDDILKIPAAALRFSPPAEVAAALNGETPQKNNTSSGGLMAMPPRRSNSAQSGAAGQTVWLVRDGELTGSIAVLETGANDRTWVEVRGEALGELQEGDQLAVAFTKGTAGTANAGTMR